MDDRRSSKAQSRESGAEKLAEDFIPLVSFQEDILTIDYGNSQRWTEEMSWRSFEMARPFYRPDRKFRVLIILRSPTVTIGSFDQFLLSPIVQQATAATAISAHWQLTEFCVAHELARLPKLDYPIRTFRSDDQAIEWLRQIPYMVEPPAPADGNGMPA